ncbi:MAG: hypothetical protein V3V08_01415 [Nannocystaceae bacterium]
MLKLSHLSLLTILGASVALAACAGSGARKGRKQSARAAWIESPSSGERAGARVHIAELAVSFETPDVLYVYRDCGEAAHGPDGPEKNWIPVIQCQGAAPGGSDDDDLDGSGFDGDRVMTIYVADKARAINERAVETMRDEYERAGITVAEIAYHEDYLTKEHRRGIEAKLHTFGEDDRYPEQETLRFMFPVDDVVFIASIDYPYGTDVSGIMSDWQRILWNFQLDEDGPLFGGTQSDEDEAEEE